MSANSYNYYNKFGGGYYYQFLKANPEFGCKEFEVYVISHNRGDRDSGELGDIAKHEVLRLAAEFEERIWRFSDCII